MNEAAEVYILPIIDETSRAILVETEVGEVWLPKSQIEYDGEPGDEVEIEIPDWLAIKEELA